jgi:hypothetical protein
MLTRIRDSRMLAALKERGSVSRVFRSQSLLICMCVGPGLHSSESQASKELEDLFLEEFRTEVDHC